MCSASEPERLAGGSRTAQVAHRLQPGYLIAHAGFASQAHGFTDLPKARGESLALYGFPDDLKDLTLPPGKAACHSHTLPFLKWAGPPDGPPSAGVLLRGSGGPASGARLPAFTGRGGVLSCGHISISPARKPRGLLVRGSVLAQGIPGCLYRGSRARRPQGNPARSLALPSADDFPIASGRFLYSVVIVQFSLFGCGRSDSRSRYSLLSDAKSQLSRRECEVFRW